MFLVLWSLGFMLVVLHGDARVTPRSQQYTQTDHPPTL